MFIWPCAHCSVDWRRRCRFYWSDFVGHAEILPFSHWLSRNTMLVIEIVAIRWLESFFLPYKSLIYLLAKKGVLKCLYFCLFFCVFFVEAWAKSRIRKKSYKKVQKSRKTANYLFSFFYWSQLSVKCSRGKHKKIAVQFLEKRHFSIFAFLL